MAGRGPASSGTRSRTRDQERLDAQMTDVAGDGQLHGPELTDDMLGEGQTWHARTKAWWATWRSSPQATLFTATDWDFLIDTALMHHTMWSAGRWEFAAELRLRAAKFGATPEDRMRLKWKTAPAGGTGKTKPAGKTGAKSGTVTSIADRRSRLAEQ